MSRRPRTSHIGPLGAGSKDTPHYVPPRIAFDIPERITNATVPRDKGTYSQAEAHKGSAIRPDCMVAFSLPSRGTSC